MLSFSIAIHYHFMLQLFNFAAMFPVDFTFQQTKQFLGWHMVLITSLFLCCVIFIMASVGGNLEWINSNIPDSSVLSDDKVLHGLGSVLCIFGVMSIISCVCHWKWSIKPLYGESEERIEMEVS